jgi:hypothetical protein
MDQRGELFSSRIATIGLAVALAMVARTAAFAQQKPIPIDAASAPAAAKAQNVISKPGSYILNKNITNTSKNGAISLMITASNVTIDLQGFVISATGSNSGAAISAVGTSNVVVRNGIITGFDGAAIILGNNSNVTSITATGNGSGITCGSGCLVSNCIVQGNTGLGMTFVDTTSGYAGDILLDNNSGGDQVSGGTSLHQNICNGTTC